MERASRRLVAFSLVSFIGVVAFGSVRGMPPVKALLDDPELLRVSALFHSHFDQLCWLGAAATGASLWILRDAYRGPAWAPRLIAWSYPVGAVLFSGAFLLKLAGLKLGSVVLARGAFGAVVSLGGTLLFVALVAAAAIAWGLRGAGSRQETT